MSINTSLKRLAACLLSAALVAAGLPAGILSAGKQPITAEAGESYVGKPLMAMDTCDISGNEFYDADVDIVNNAVINIGKNGKSSLTINGMLSIGSGASVNLYNGSYLVINGPIHFSSNTKETCSGGSKIIMTSTELHMTSSTTYVYEDFIGTDLTDLRYHPTAITTKDYFLAGDTYYTFNGASFSKVTDNSRTLKLKELCTNNASEGFNYKYSSGFYSAFIDAVFNGNLTTGIRGYTIDGETCDAMYIPKNNYSSAAAFSSAYTALINSGVSYVISEEEAASVITAPRFTDALMNVGDNLVLFFEFSDVSEETVDDFSIVLSGRCKEDGQEQSLFKKGSSYAVCATLSANNIRDEISGKIYYKGIETGIPFSYSAEQYLSRLAELKPRYKEMCDAIDFYGKAAENYFDDATNDISSVSAAYMNKYKLGSDDVENTFDEMETLYNYTYKPKFTSDMAKVSLVLESTVALRLYIPGLYDGQLVGGENGFTAKTSKYGVYIEIPGMTPLGMHNIVNLSSQLNLGAFTWVYRVLTDPVLSQEDKSRDLAVAIYTYSQSVYDFVKANSGN